MDTIPIGKLNLKITKAAQFLEETVQIVRIWKNGNYWNYSSCLYVSNSCVQSNLSNNSNNSVVFKIGCHHSQKNMIWYILVS